MSVSRFLLDLSKKRLSVLVSRMSAKVLFQIEEISFLAEIRDDRERNCDRGLQLMMMMARSDDHQRVKEVHCRDVYVRGADVYTRLALIWRRRGEGKANGTKSITDQSPANVVPETEVGEGRRRSRKKEENEIFFLLSSLPFLFLPCNEGKKKDTAIGSSCGHLK